MAQPVSLALLVPLLGCGAAVLPAQEPPAGEDPPPTVAEVRVHGLDLLDPSVRLPRRLPLRPGVPYTLERVEAMDAVLVHAFAERGRPYIAVEVDPEFDPASGTVRVRLEVTEIGQPF